MKWLGVDGRPKVQGVARRGTLGVETLENVLLKVDRKAATALSRAAVNRTRTTPLRAAASEAVEMAQVAKHPFDADLATKVAVIHRKTGGTLGRRSGFGREIDNRRRI